MISIINYGIGNLDSVARAFRKCGADVCVASTADDVAQAEAIVLPGVGSFDSAMLNLQQTGLLPLLNRRVLEEKTPVLGICLGFQMFTRSSEEGTVAGLGWIDGDTRRFVVDDPASQYKIPHMGWDAVDWRQAACPLTEGIPTNSTFYFAHSYYVATDHAEDVLGAAQYVHPFTAAVAKGNIFGVQFHPEKSHASGLKLIENFIRQARHE